MQTIRLTKKTDPWYPAVRELCAGSFPVYEQRTEAQQKRAFADNRYHSEAYIQNNSLIGWMDGWEFDNYIYIEHLAIHPDLRGKKYGTRLLENIKEKYDKLLILEIDPIVDDKSTRRLHFYQLAGFFVNPYPHVHPPYQPGYEGHSLVVLSNRRSLTAQEYRQFYEDMVNIIMK